MWPKIRKYIKGDRTPIGDERPRLFVGGLWHELGELQFKFLVDQGLQPHHALLDIACGSLRAGVRLIPFLDTGNYLGIDIDGSLIEHGRKVELGERLEALKHPEFVVSGLFEFDRFSRQPDFAIAQSLFTHLIAPDIELCLRNLARVAKPETRLFATFFEADWPFTNPSESHPQRQFKFTRQEMERFGETAGLRANYIGGWGHPRGQKMICYMLT